MIDARDRAGPALEGRVELLGFVDDPGAADHGRLVYHHERNTVCVNARKIMAHALAGADKIASVGWGSGTTPPDRLDTRLGQELQVSDVVSPANYPTEDSVLFTSTLPPGQGTDQRFSEVGLKSQSGELFARFTFPPVDKFERLRLAVNWQIFFVR